MNINKHLPILEWLPNYKKQFLSGDLSAGFTVGVMLIPQGMAYAMIAGLPPVYGLYAALIPQVIYALFGTSRQLAVGPSAMDSLLVAAGISSIVAIGSEHYITLAILLSMMMGVVQLSFGVFRLGFLVNFLSKPVISGFTSAAAIIIGLNQLKYILGIELIRESNVFKIILNAIEKVEQINGLTVVISIGAIIIIKYSKKIHPFIPGALTAVVTGILLVYFGNLHKLGIAIVGDIPEGLPSFSIPDFESQYLIELVPIAFTLALIAFMESISVAKAIQTKHKEEYKIDNNQEMIGIGMGNIIGSMFGCFPTAGGFGRSAVNEQAGAKTNLAAIISASIVGLTLLFLTPLFYYLPNAILGSIIVVAVLGLIDFNYPKFLWNANKEDFIMLTVTFLVTLGFGIKEGIITGVLLSLGSMIYRSTKPHIAVLGRLPNTDDYRNINRFDEIEVRDDVLIVRHDAQLYFANIDNFIDHIQEEIEKKPKLKLLILHCGSVSYIDSTGLQGLKEFISELSNKEIGIAFSGVIGPVRDFLFRANFISELGKQHFFIDVQSAIDCMDGSDDLLRKNNFDPALQNNVFRGKDL